MKNSGTWLIPLLASVLCGSAQVTVEVTQEQQQFLAGEPLKVAVRITNRSGRALKLGADEDWLTFSMESREGTVVPKLAEVPVQGEFSLESSKVAIKRVDLAPYFMLSIPGAYQIEATVRIRDLKTELTSPPKSFDLIQGVKIWEQDVGVPSVAGNGAEPEVRRYTLQQANYFRGQTRLYLRVTDQYGKLIRVSAVGQMTSFGHPEPQIDRSNRLHILHLEGASYYNYAVFDLQGNLVLHQTWEIGNSRPRLRLDDEGNVTVAGGTRRIMTTDFPPSKNDEDDSNPAAPPLMPPPTTSEVSKAGAKGQ
ncbi:MAG TPA: hypothetical protein VKY92_24140 [Verrucomicrobiae bacterium]|nr:hypothetical protein [Verrucomicrobiae bacterium]